MKKTYIKILLWLVWFACFAELIFAHVYSLIDPAPRYHIFNSINRSMADWAFWTTWSNWFTLIFFFLILMNGKFGFYLPGPRAWISLVSYMSVTMMLFWVALLGTFSEPDPNKNILAYFSNNYNNVTKWLNTIFLHVVSSAIVFIVFSLKIFRGGIINYKTWHAKNMFISLIFPICYLVFVVIRGFLVLDGQITDYVTSVTDQSNYFWQYLHKFNIDEIQSAMGLYAFPYFFFDWNLPNGKEMFSFAVAGILFIYVGFQYLWIFINNKLSKRTDVTNVVDNYESNRNEKGFILGLNKIGFTFEIISILFYVVVFSLSIYRLTDIDKYTKSGGGIIFLGNLFYTVLYSFLILFSILGIIFSILTIAGIFSNNTATLFIGLICSLFSATLFGIIIIGMVLFGVRNMYHTTRKNITDNEQPKPNIAINK